LSANELTTIENQQWINVHIYVMKKWVQIPILLTFQDIDEMGVATDNLKFDQVQRSS
jgi:hypothetical protein